MTTSAVSNYLQTSLETCLIGIEFVGQQRIKITLLFDYLNSINRHPSQQSSLSEFMAKWKGILQKSCQKMMIVSYNGIWPPSSLSSSHISKQPRWEEFILKYEKSFSGPAMVDSENQPEYQPLNFKELVHLTFWKELYEEFGFQILSHIFEKCAVLFEVEVGLYLIVAYPEGSIYQRLAKYEGISRTTTPCSNTNRKGVSKTGNGGTSSTNSTNKRLPSPLSYAPNPYAPLVEKPGKVVTIDEAKNYPDKQVVGISEVPANTPEPKSSTSNRKTGRCKRKNVDLELISTERNDSDHHQPRPQPSSKRQKMNTDLSSASKEANPSVCPCPSNPSSFPPRWIKPKPNDLIKLTEHRNALLNAHSLVKAKAPDPTNPNVVEGTNYVHISKDQDFKAKNKLFVLKQKATLSTSTPVLPKDWKDLKLPEDLKTESGGKKEILITVYHISETLAKKLGIRLKPKGRSRRKNRHPPPEPEEANPEEKVIPSPSVKEAISDTSERKVLASKPPDNGASSADVAKPAMYPPMHPFVSYTTLPIAACLYNKSSWSSWPASHSLSKAVSAYSSADCASAVRKVADAILKAPVCSEAAYKYLMPVINENWTNTSDDSIALNQIILNIVQAHAKFKEVHLHRLVKSCVLHWRSKYGQKQERKNKSCNGKWGGVPNSEGNLPNPPVPEVIELEDRPTPAPMPSSATPTSASGIDIFEISPQSSVADPSSPSSSVYESCSSSIGHAESESSPTTMDTTDAIPPKGAIIKKHDPEPVKVKPELVPPRQNKAVLIRKCSGNTKRQRSIKSLRYPVPYNVLMQTLKQIFHVLKLESLLGSKHNVRGFFKFLRKAIILGGAKSSLHLGELMALVKASESPFLQVCGGDQLATVIFMAKLVYWLFNDYALILLKTSFYITECSDTRFHLKFFLREYWSSASHKMRSRLLQEGALKHRESPPSQGRANALIRYVPKANYTLRSLLIRKKSNWKISEAELTLFKLLLHFIDARICRSRRTLLPSTIQTNWRTFSRSWKEQGSPKLYYLRMDIRDAFPSVSTEKLKEILLKIGGDRERQQNVVHKQYAVFCGTGARKVYRSSLMDSYSRNNWHSGIHSRPCIVLDLNRDKPVNLWKTLDRITAVISSSSTVKIGTKFYEFRYGLPQGWGLSSTLCSIYYGYIDSTLYIPYLETEGRLFLRVVDDYLFVTPVATEVLNLTQLIKIGCDKLTIKMNEEKFETNVFVRSDVAVPETSCECTTFCGWNFCFTCGHVSRDYTKYNGQDFCSTISFGMMRNIRNPEQFIRVRGAMIMAARLKPILLDPSINCSKRILLTVYEASALMGFRFYALCRGLYPTLTAVSDPQRAESLFITIKLCCRRLANFAHKNCHQTTSSYRVSCEGSCCAEPAWRKTRSKKEPNDSLENIPPPPSDLLKYDTLLYTSLLGFRTKLLSHSVVFKDKLLPRLNGYILHLEKEIRAVQRETVLKIVGGRKVPACFQDISI